MVFEHSLCQLNKIIVCATAILIINDSRLVHGYNILCTLCMLYNILYVGVHALKITFLCINYSGDPIPRVQYTKEEVQTWLTHQLNF